MYKIQGVEIALETKKKVYVQKSGYYSYICIDNILSNNLKDTDEI